MAPVSELPFSVTIQDLLNAGLHFGHQSKRWNPKMKRFIFDKRNGIYIIDLAKSLAQLKQARDFVYDTVAAGKSVLFVGTKRQCQDILKEAAGRCGQHYVISRWLGGTLTNFQNISSSIRHMQAIEELEQKGTLETMPQKEASRLRHELARLRRNLSGIANLKGMPGAMIVIDVNREANAVKEAQRVGIPLVALVDTNSDPDPITYPIPGNDDAIRGIKLILDLLADTVIKANAEYAVVAAQLQKEREAKAAQAPETKEQTKAAEAAVRLRKESKPRREARAPRKSDTRAAEPAAAKPTPLPTPAPAPANDTKKE